MTEWGDTQQARDWMGCPGDRAPPDEFLQKHLGLIQLLLKVQKNMLKDTTEIKSDQNVGNSIEQQRKYNRGETRTLYGKIGHITQTQSKAFFTTLLWMVCLYYKRLSCFYFKPHLK